MKPETRVRLDAALATLNHAQTLNDSGDAPTAIKEAYQASIQIAAAYMADVNGRDFLLDDGVYYIFSRTIQESGRHLQFEDKIAETVRTVFVLHEAYEPALLHETTAKDAQQMIDHVSELRGVVESVLA
jgi:hypothetical protein